MTRLLRLSTPRADRRARGDRRVPRGRGRRLERSPGRRGGERAVPRPRVHHDAAPEAGGAADDRHRQGDREREARQEPERALVRLGGRHRHRAPDRLLEQHEGLDRRRDGRRARVRGAEPGPASLGRLLQCAADRRAAAHDRPQEGRGGPGEVAEARRGDAHQRRPRRRGRAGARLGPRRGASRAPLRRGRRGQLHEPRRRPRAARRAEDPGVHGRHPVARLPVGRPREDRQRDGRNVRRRGLAGGAHEDLRRARLPARQRVPAPLSLGRRARPAGRGQRQGRRRGAGRVLVHDAPRPARRRPTSPRSRTSCSSPGRWCRSSSGSCSRWPSSRSARCGASAPTRRSSPAWASS